MPLDNTGPVVEAPQTGEEVCEEWGISPRTLDTWKTEGLKYYKRGHIIRFKRSDIYAFLERKPRDEDKPRLGRPPLPRDKEGNIIRPSPRDADGVMVRKVVNE